GGVRVWPAEVAAVLTICPGVQDTVVVVREDEQGHSILVAYIRPDSGADQSSLRKALVTFARDHLPARMIPSFFVFLAQWPLDLNGGVLRDALPPPTSEQAPVAADPQSKLEREIAAIWRKVLNIDTVSIHDNFFDRGGHSLLLIKLQSELQTALNLQLSIVDLFKCPTISALTRFIQQDHPALPTQTEVQQLQSRVTKQKDALQRQKVLSQERRINRGTD
ncbi:MAG TPA: phosphopantetheine-binding protein, partial [Ktedonobacteraceae bacterium]|nr:phosphopantetheine-binding protein [Ktedonobacteraceae bacterium]